MKPVHINLSFTGDIREDNIRRRLPGLIDTSFHAAKLQIHFMSKLVLRLRLKDKVPNWTASFCVYWFLRPCENAYLGRTNKHMSKHVREHYSA